jgi:hypothetical protein
VSEQVGRAVRIVIVPSRVQSGSARDGRIKMIKPR